MTINERITLLIKELSMNVNSFSVSIGVNSTIIHNITKGRNNPSFDILEKIILKFGNINANWLLTGSGNMKRGPDDESVCVNCKRLTDENNKLKDELLDARNEIISLYRRMSNAGYRSAYKVDGHRFVNEEKITEAKVIYLWQR